MYCYHEIVHNQVVVERFRDLGVVFVDDIAEVPEGKPIMLSAHGSAPEVVAAARERGSYVVNAVCPLVTKVHHEVKTRAGKGYRIVYVGHEGHEEAVGTMAVAPDAIDRVESVEEVDALPETDQPVALLAQTTLSHRDWAAIAERAEQRFPGLWKPGRATCASPRPTASPRSPRSPLAATPSSSSAPPTRRTPALAKVARGRLPAVYGSTAPPRCRTTSPAPSA